MQSVKIGKLLRQLADRLQYLRNLDQRRSEVSAAIQAQAGRFCHVMLGSLTHQPVEDLVEKLNAIIAANRK